ncbi:MAG TPA: YqaJ viral recombinase family protein [Solirubrobacterales bacterium]|nr:YqaJ viral recombinase family protein [Solirubrobacterales bacterium]
MAVAQRTPEWFALRRESVTGTDIPVILGLSPYKSEAALAREKGGEDEPPVDDRQARMRRLGLALEAVIRDEDELEHGFRLRRVNSIKVHPTIGWARASLDFERVGQRCIVEAKSSAARRWDEGLPQDVEAQVRWQMGVAGYPRAHVAALRHGSELVCFDLEHDPALFDGLVEIASDFRRRLEAGGPFAENAASVKARWPSDDGTEIEADPDLAEAVHALIAVRGRRRLLEADEEQLETAIKARMGEHAVLIGQGFRVLWKRTRDRSEIDWQRVATPLLAQLPETEREALVGLHTVVRTGFRPFRIVLDKEASE